MHPTPTIRRTLACSALCLAPAVLGAQDSTAARKTPRDSTAQAVQGVVVKAAVPRRAGYAPRRTTTATKTDTPLRDVPQAVTVVGRELIADQAMQGMADVVRYVPGITMGQGEGHRDAPTIRGQSSTADFFVDGVRDDAQYLRDVYNVERIEALKGANAMMFGRGGGGGVINRVTKDAVFAPVRSLALEGGSWQHRRATLDAGQGMGTRAAGRVNAMWENSDGFRDFSALERQGINPTGALLLGGTMVRAGYEYFADRRTVDRGIPSFRGRPAHADISTFFGDPAVSRSRAEVHAASALVERGAADGLMLRNRTRWTTYDKFYQNVFANDSLRANGSEASLGGYNNSTDRDNLFNQTDVTYRLVSGAIAQTLLVGAEVGRQRTDNFRNTAFFNDTNATRWLVDYATPQLDVPVAFRQSATDANNHVEARVAAAYLQDQLALGAHLQAVAGVRYDRFDVDFTNHRDTAARTHRLSRRDRMISPRAGLVLKPVEAVSVYGTYSVSYLPSSGDQFSSLTATSATLQPEQFRNRELGAKWDVRSDLSITGAVYRVERSNTTAKDPLDNTRTVQTGRQRTTGWEVGVAGEVTSRWQVAGGYAAQRAIIVSPTAAAPRVGVSVPLVPGHTYSLWNRVQATRRLGLGLGLVRQGASWAAIDNTVRLPAFSRVDAAAFVRLHENVKLQANVENVLDVRYYPTSQGNNNIMPGAPRTLRMSITATR